MNELIKITQREINGDYINSANAREIYDLLEVKTAYTTWLQRTVDKYGFIGGEDFESLSILKPSGQTEKLFIVNIDMAKELCMIADTPNGKLARKYFIEIEKKSRIQNISIPSTYIEALEALVISEKHKQQAIDTKAEIGNKREATAMNTASQAVKKVTKLEIQVDESKLYSTIRKQEKIHKTKFKWHPLKKYSLENGINIKKIDDDLYENVNSYSTTVWLEVYGVTL